MDKEVTDKPKKGPGRDCKKKAEEEILGENKPKRGRGRPRKDTAKSDEDFTAEMRGVATSLPIKKVTRREKRGAN